MSDEKLEKKNFFLHCVSVGGKGHETITFFGRMSVKMGNISPVMNPLKLNNIQHCGFTNTQQCNAHRTGTFSAVFHEWLNKKIICMTKLIVISWGMLVNATNTICGTKQRSYIMNIKIPCKMDGIKYVTCL